MVILPPLLPATWGHRNDRLGSKRELAIFGLMSALAGCGHSVARACAAGFIAPRLFRLEPKGFLEAL
jgi:hypothetical protein